MHSVYILTLSNGKYCIGQTRNLTKRIDYHEKGWSRYTKSYRPLVLVYDEKYENKTEAIKRERYLKSLKSRVALEKLIKSDGGPIV